MQPTADTSTPAADAEAAVWVDPDGTVPPATAPTDGSRFAIVRRVAYGGLGLVSIALDRELDRDVALKEIHQRLADQPELRRRFTLEAKITGGLEHPGIVPVYALGAFGDGRPFYAMRFIQGDSLQSAIEEFHVYDHGESRGERALRLRQLLRRLVDVCNAIDYAHARGVLHRDLKPSNIMLGNYGETLVVDWGVAKALGYSAGGESGSERPLVPLPEMSDTETQIGAAIGTPAYMSPEQAAGRVDLVGAASDIYSLGATLYALLTGRPPVDSEHDPQIQQALKEHAAAAKYVDRQEQWDIVYRLVLQKVQTGHIEQPRCIRRDIPRALEAICLKAMALRPAVRYGSPRALADDLEHWMADEPVNAYRESWPASLARWGRKHRTWTRAAAAALLVVSLVSCAAAVFIDRARANEIRMLRITETAEDFIRGLDAIDWTAAHVEQMERWLAELAALRCERLPKYRADLIAGFVYAIAAAIQQTELTEQDVDRLRLQIDALEQRSPAQAETLRNQLAQRERHWQPVFNLEAPFENLGSVFPLSQVRVEGDTFCLQDQSAPNYMLASQISAEGNVRLEATFAPGWERSAAVGLAINLSDESGYQFVLSKTSSDAPLKQTAEAHLVRGSVVLRKAAVVAPSGPLTLVATRAGDRLTFQVNAGAPIEFDDPFALSTATPGVFGLICPEEVAVARMVAWRQALPADPSPLEQGDALYSSAKFDQALAYYDAALRISSVERAPEPRYKAALCLERLGRETEAVQLLESLVKPTTLPAAGQRDEWVIRAACRLWSLEVRRGNSEGAAQLAERLGASYSVEELARLVPSGERESLFRDLQPNDAAPLR